MPVVDRRVDRLKDITHRIEASTTFTQYLRLVHEQKLLEAELRAELTRVNQLTSGWTYMPPGKS